MIARLDRHRRARAAAPAPEIHLGERQRGTYTAYGYRSARMAEREGRTPTAGGSVVHEVDREKLQAQSREFRRDNGIYAGMVRRARSFIVGTGFKLQALSRSRRWNARTEALWAEWWRRPEVTGLLAGARVEAMVADELLTCGETGVVLTDRGKLQLVEAEQIAGPKRGEDGIERDGLGTPTGYWLSPYRTNGTLSLAKARRVAPADFLYVAAPERPSSSRALPPCQSAFPMLHRINDVCDSEALAWQMQARIALVVNRTSGLPTPASIAHEVSDGDSEGSPSADWVTELDYAVIFHGAIGDDVKGMERTAPAKNFEQTLVMFFRLLGLPLGLPLELLLLDWTKSNYSQSRAVLEQAKVAFLDWQLLLEEHFYRAVYLWWLDLQVRGGAIPARPDQGRHEWIKPACPWIDQLAEAQAYGEKVDRGFTTHAAVCKSLDTDRETVVLQLEREAIEAIEAAKRVEDATGVLPPWEPFAGHKAPASVTPAPSGAAATAIDDEVDEEAPVPEPEEATP